MPWFRKKSAEVIRKGVGNDTVVEERTTRMVGGELVEVRRVHDPRLPTPAPEQKPSAPRRTSRSNGPRPRPVDDEIIIPPETARKQMLVRTMPHQTQIVVLEGPSLVEHYVAQSGTASLVGNVYVGKVKNVLPGMEAAFVDFGASKNGVVYADDISYDRSIHGRKHPRIEEVLHEGDEVLVQVVRDAMGAKGARLTNQPSLPGRFLVLVPDSDAQGISRRLPDEERTRLRSLVDEVKPDSMGVIVRTAAEGASRNDIEEDVTRLVRDLGADT